MGKLNPLLVILSRSADGQGTEARALAFRGHGLTPATAIRDLARQLLKAGINPELPLRICYGNYQVRAVLPSIAYAVNPDNFDRKLLCQIAPPSGGSVRQRAAA